MRLVTHTSIELTTEELSYLRKHRPVARIKMARLLGVSYSTFHAWEWGDRRPPLDKYEQWLRLVQYPHVARLPQPVGLFIVDPVLPGLDIAA
jgi:DNA-binding transcriptional regulator YiaG